MSTYTPDRWVVIEVTSPKYGTIRKILASWKGGYLDGDSWKISSGNLPKTIETGMSSGEIQFPCTVYVYPQESGSIYRCFKDNYGLTMYSEGIYRHYEAEIAKLPGSSIRILDEQEAYDSY